MESALGVLISIGIIIFVALGTVLAMYLFSSFGLYAMAKNQDLDYAYLAFIPIVKCYTIGSIIGPIKLFGGYLERKIVGLIVLAAYLMSFVLANSISILFQIFDINIFTIFIIIIYSLFYCVLYGLILYFLYSRFTKKHNAILMAIISVLIFFLPPILIFILRKNNYNNPYIEKVELVNTL